MLTLWDRGNDARTLQEAVSRMFDRTYGLMPEPQKTIALDLIETAEEYIVKASLPGCSKDKVNVSFQDDTLTIQAYLNHTAAPEKARFLLRERFNGEVSRSVTLPVRVDADKAGADYKDGVLTLTLPKSDAVKPRTIKVG